MRSFGHSIAWVWTCCVLFLDEDLSRVSAGVTNEPTAGPSEIKTTNGSTFVAGTAVKQTKSRVVLTIGGKDLRDKDITSRSDPFCQVEIQDLQGSRWLPLGKTETQDNNLNPIFEKTIEVEYHFEISQTLRFAMYDEDRDRNEFLGFAKVTIETLVREGYMEIELNLNENQLNWTDKDIAEKKRQAMQKKTSSLTNKVVKTLYGDPKRPSYILLWAEQYKDGQQSNGENLVVMDVQGVKLTVGGKREWFGLNKPNPYIDIWKEVSSENKTFYRLVHKTEVKNGTKKPHWSQLLVMYSTLADEDPKRKLKFECRDSQKRSDHGHIGEFVTTVEEILNSKDREFVLIDAKKQRSSKKYKNSGKLKIKHFEIIKTASFLDYATGELDMQAIIGIDFTLSNREPHDRFSLHYIDPNGIQLNQYEQAITAVVSIIQVYDKDKLIPTFGYGAKLPPRLNETYHIFPVNFNSLHPECKEVEGVLAAYHDCVTKIKFSMPTHFAPIINYAVKTARGYKQGESYAILLIITDGQVMDPEQTKNAIIDGSDLPLSIIIVGVGSDNFDAMEELDGDGGLLQSKTKTAKRDIVQFVPFKKYYKPNDEVAKKLLAQEVLAEVPKQLISYMATHNLMPKFKLKPKPPRSSNVSQSTLTHEPPNPKFEPNTSAALQSIDDEFSKPWSAKDPYSTST